MFNPPTFFPTPPEDDTVADGGNLVFSSDASDCDDCDDFGGNGGRGD